MLNCIVVQIPRSRGHMLQCICFLNQISKIVRNVVFIRVLELKLLQVLAPGGAKDSIEVISDFLGREPSILSYIENKAKYTL